MPIRTPPSPAAHTDPVLLIWSGEEALAQGWSRMCEKRGIAHEWAKCEAHGGDIAAMLDHIRPWGLVHADAPSTAEAIGLAGACESRGIASLHLVPAPDGHATHEALRAAEDDIPPSFPASALLIPWEGRASIADLARMNIALDLLIDGQGGLHDPIRSPASEPPETARQAAARGAFGNAAQI